MNFLKDNIFNIKSETDFIKSALEIFNFQAENNSVYRNYLKYLNINPKNINSLNKIPFLPVDFFKTHNVLIDKYKPEKIFLSSGTSLSGNSKHLVADLSLYEKSFTASFRHFYGDIKNYVLLALLPSYAEREGSSLIYMVEKLLEISGSEHGGFYLYNLDQLYDKIIFLEKTGKKILLLGVSFALTDFFEKYKLNLKNTVIMETGGMKGRRKETVKEELYDFLCEKSGVSSIHSEYGMTELLSQAYSKGNNIFYCPPQMKVLIRDSNDPFSYLETGKTGGINVIDLTNVYSCSFIETKDLGRINSDGGFEVLGRFDFSDVRGCNLLIV